jgi:hypothetical protein
MPMAAIFEGAFIAVLSGEFGGSCHAAGVTQAQSARS